MFKTLLPMKKEYRNIICGEYNRLMLFLIKAWDIKQDDYYIKIIKKLEDILHGYIEDWVGIINKAQVEYRLNDYKSRNKR